MDTQKIALDVGLRYLLLECLPSVVFSVVLAELWCPLSLCSANTGFGANVTLYFSSTLDSFSMRPMGDVLGVVGLGVVKEMVVTVEGVLPVNPITCISWAVRHGLLRDCTPKHKMYYLVGACLCQFD